MEVERECMFCHTSTNIPLDYGDFEEAGGIYAHFFCILLSSALLPNGEDDQGIHGFLLDDIITILDETDILDCHYCGLPNANIICAHIECRKVFHYPCALRHGAVAQFVNDFPSFCDEHNEIRRENRRRLEAAADHINCIYCHERIELNDDYYTSICCRTCNMHINCLKMHALVHGQYTRCPHCLNEEDFVESIKRHGVYIPLSYLMRNLQHEAIQEYANVRRYCEMNPCRCRHGVGSEHDAMRGACKLIVCRGCGGHWAHRRCKKTVGNVYLCAVCRPVVRPRREETTKKTKNPYVSLVRMDINQLRASGFHIPHPYNLRSSGTCE